jgi:hypothetical protein
MTQRTESQNNAIHLYCERMAEKLNDTEASLQQVCTLPIQLTKENFKENIWKPVQQALYPDVKSTTQLSTDQVSEVYRTVDKIISERWHVSEPFPSNEPPLMGE